MGEITPCSGGSGGLAASWSGGATHVLTLGKSLCCLCPSPLLCKRKTKETDPCRICRLRSPMVVELWGARGRGAAVGLASPPFKPLTPSARAPPGSFWLPCRTS